MNLLRSAMLVLFLLIFLITGYNCNAIWHDKISLWSDVVTKSPNKLRPNNELANAYSSNNLTMQALKYYLIANSISPDDAVIHNNLGMLYVLIGQYETAIKHYQMAIMLSPDSYFSFNSLGHVYWKMGLQKASIENYMKAISLNPDYSEPHFNLGLIYIEMRNYGDARKELEAVLEINPFDADAAQLLRQISNK